MSDVITFHEKGDFKKLDRFLEKALEVAHIGILDKYGRLGVEALSAATPVDTGLTAASWSYEIRRTSTTARLIFKNSNIQNGVPIAIILHYGHGTRNGGYVRGRDYINDAIQPVFDQLAEECWKEISKA